MNGDGPISVGKTSIRPLKVQADYDLRNRLKRGDKRREVHLRGWVFVADYDNSSSFGLIFDAEGGRDPGAENIAWRRKGA